jgi:hypothetical protein
MLLQALGRWDAALATAHAHCPLQANAVHHAAAHHAELLGLRATAVRHYSATDTGHLQVRLHTHWPHVALHVRRCEHSLRAHAARRVTLARSFLAAAAAANAAPCLVAPSHSAT